MICGDCVAAAQPQRHLRTVPAIASGVPPAGTVIVMVFAFGVICPPCTRRHSVFMAFITQTTGTFATCTSTSPARPSRRATYGARLLPNNLATSTSRGLQSSRTELSSRLSSSMTPRAVASLYASSAAKGFYWGQLVFCRAMTAHAPARNGALHLRRGGNSGR